MAVYIGVDIRQEKVVAVAVKVGSEGVSLLESILYHYGDDEALFNVLKSLAEKYKEADGWSVGLPTKEFSFRHLTFPFSKAKAISAALKYELSELLPFSAESMEARADILIVGEETLTLAVSIPKERLTFYKKLLTDAGIRARFLLPSISALKIFHDEFIDGKQNTLVVDADDDRMSLVYIGEDGYIDYLEADNDIQKLNRFVLAIEESGKGEKPVDYYKGGDGLLHLSGVEENRKWEGALSKKLGFASSLKTLMIPLGLAMAGTKRVKNGLNFSIDKGISWKFASGLQVQAIALGLIILLWTSFLLVSNHFKAKDYKSIKGEIKEVFHKALPGAKIVKPLFQLKSKTKELEKKMSVAGLIENGGDDFLSLLKILSDKIPATPKVLIDEVVFNKRGVGIKGSAGSFKAVELLKNSLSSLNGFAKAEVLESAKSADGSSVKFRVGIKK